MNDERGDRDRCVGGVDADPQQIDADHLVEAEVAMPLKRGHQERQRGLQPLPADSICCFPKNHQGLPDGFVVDPWSSPPPGRFPDSRIAGEQSNRVFSVIARNRDEFVEDSSRLSRSSNRSGSTPTSSRSLPVNRPSAKRSTGRGCSASFGHSNTPEPGRPFRRWRNLSAYFFALSFNHAASSAW